MMVWFESGRLEESLFFLPRCRTILLAVTTWTLIFSASFEPSLEIEA